MKAFTADKGEQLLDVALPVNSGVGPPMTFMIDGKQYIAVMGGTGAGGRGGGGGGGGGGRGAGTGVPPPPAGGVPQEPTAAAAQRGNNASPAPAGGVPQEPTAAAAQRGNNAPPAPAPAAAGTNNNPKLLVYAVPN